MGLDMYLTYRCEAKKDGDSLHMATRFDDSTESCDFKICVGYWRKANAIHSWFVDHIQEGNDDCHEYKVPFEALNRLRFICEKIKDKADEMHLKMDADCDYPEGFGAFCASLLPTSSGFFFGTTDYDSWYLHSIVNTIGIIDGLYAMMERNYQYDFDENGKMVYNGVVTYRASW